MEFEGLSVRARSTDPAAAEAFVRKWSHITPEEHRRVCTLPQHHPDLSTNEEWLAARKYRFTGSTAGAACHQNPYDSVEQFLFNKIQQTPMDERGKRYCAYGTLHEDDAEEAFGVTLDAKKNKINRKGAELLDWRAQHLGLYVCKAPGFGFLGMSPDGILHTTWRMHTQVAASTFGATFPVNDDNRSFDIDFHTNVVSRDSSGSLSLTPGQEYYVVGTNIPGGSHKVTISARGEAASDGNQTQLTATLTDGTEMMTSALQNLRFFTLGGGILKIKELIEYKCPATWEKKRDNPHIYKKELVPKLVPGRFREELLARGEITSDGLPLCNGRHKIACPPYYYAQVQYGMQLFKMSGVDLPRAHFVVWCPERTSHIKIERDDIFGQWLIRMMADVYRNQYAPAIVRHLRGGDRQRRAAETKADDAASEFSGFSLKRKRSDSVGQNLPTVDPASEFSGFSLKRKS